VTGTVVRKRRQGKRGEDECSKPPHNPIIP
jgi:hypothetical protein